MKPLTFGSLFAGIGGLDLGLERAGMQCRWQVEIDPYATKVLEKHWPHVKRYSDVRTVGAELEPVDLICGGFPCQDISNAGKRAGIDGERSGLWSEYARVVRLLRPRFVLVENVAALLGRGLGRVVGDLARIGYDAEWDCFPAAAFGALHIRNRLFLLAYANVQRPLRTEGNASEPGGDESKDWLSVGNGADVADAERQGLALGESERRDSCQEQPTTERSGSADVHDAFSRRHGTPQETVFSGRGGIELSSEWATEPDVGRVAHGVPARVDRLRGLGNAVVPQVAEWIGRRIIAGGNTSDRAD